LAAQPASKGHFLSKVSALSEFIEYLPTASDLAVKCLILLALLPHTQPLQPMIKGETARKGNTTSYHKRLRPSQANQKTLNGF
jgi:hypothetical protein